MEILKWKYIYDRLLRQLVFHCPERIDLLEMVDESRLAWQSALKEFNFGDENVIDYLTYKIIAAERRYMVLLNQARTLGITAWPVDQMKPIALTAPNSGGNNDGDR